MSSSKRGVSNREEGDSYWYSRGVGKSDAGETKTKSKPLSTKQTTTHRPDGHVYSYGGTDTYTDLSSTGGHNGGAVHFGPDISATLHHKEMVRIHHLWNECRKELRAAEDELAREREAHKRSVMELTERHRLETSDLKSELGRVKDKLRITTEELEAARRALKSLKQHADALAESNAQLLERIKDLEREKAASASLAKDLGLEIESLHARIAQLESENLALEAENTRLKDGNRAIRSEKDNVFSSQRRAILLQETENKNLKDQLSDYNLRCVSLSNQLRAALEQIEDLEKKLSGCYFDMSRLKQELADDTQAGLRMRVEELKRDNGRLLEILNENQEFKDFLNYYAEDAGGGLAYQPNPQLDPELRLHISSDGKMSWRNPLDAGPAGGITLGGAGGHGGTGAGGGAGGGAAGGHVPNWDAVKAIAQSEKYDKLKKLSKLYELQQDKGVKPKREHLYWVPVEAQRLCKRFQEQYLSFLPENFFADLMVSLNEIYYKRMQDRCREVSERVKGKYEAKLRQVKNTIPYDQVIKNGTPSVPSPSKAVGIAAPANAGGRIAKTDRASGNADVMAAMRALERENEALRGAMASFKGAFEDEKRVISVHAYVIQVSNEVFSDIRKILVQYQGEVMNALERLVASAPGMLSPMSASKLGAPPLPSPSSGGDAAVNRELIGKVSVLNAETIHRVDNAFAQFRRAILKLSNVTAYSGLALRDPASYRDLAADMLDSAAQQRTKVWRVAEQRLQHSESSTTASTRDDGDDDSGEDEDEDDEEEEEVEYIEERVGFVEESSDAGSESSGSDGNLHKNASYYLARLERLQAKKQQLPQKSTGDPRGRARVSSRGAAPSGGRRPEERDVAERREEFFHRSRKYMTRYV